MMWRTLKGLAKTRSIEFASRGLSTLLLLRGSFSNLFVPLQVAFYELLLISVLFAISHFVDFNWLQYLIFDFCTKQEATAMNPDMTVEKIEIQQQAVPQ